MQYTEALLETIRKWAKNPIDDEWLFEKFRTDVVGLMSPIEAFSSIEETVDLLLTEDDESTATELLQTIIDLARKSDTTQVPTRLSAVAEELRKKFQARDEYARGKLHELFEHYRWR